MQKPEPIARLCQLFPNHIQKIGASLSLENLCEDYQGLSFLIASSLPHLPIKQLHNLCLRQQKNIMNRILQLKHIDIYTEIEQVCPGQKGLRNMSMQEVASRINQISTKSAQQRGIENESDQEMDSYSEEYPQKQSEESQQIQPMEIDDMDYDSGNQGKGLDNIFEEEFNTHLPWNEICIYDLN